MSRRGLLAVRRDFTPLWKRGVIASSIIVGICLISLLTRGLNLGIDFEGGGIWEGPAGNASVADVRDALRPVGLDTAQIQEGTDQAGNRRIQVRAGTLSPDANTEVRQRIADVTDSSFDDIDTTTVGPSWGAEITRSARTALIWFFIAIALYMALRLEWRMAIGGLVAVFHDIIITVGVYSVFGLEVTPATVIAFMTILGYSLYDTVVVFDRVRENEARNAGGKASFRSILNVSLSQVITRSINTTITSVLPVLSILIVGSFILGATTLREFGVALLIGLIAGTYSSLFVATPVLLWLKERDPRWAALKEREEKLGTVTATTQEPSKKAKRLARTGATGGGDADDMVDSEGLVDEDVDAESLDSDDGLTFDGGSGSGSGSGGKRPKPIKTRVPKSKPTEIPDRPSKAETLPGASHPPRPRKQKNRKKK